MHMKLEQLDRTRPESIVGHLACVFKLGLILKPSFLTLR